MSFTIFNDLGNGINLNSKEEFVWFNEVKGATKSDTYHDVVDSKLVEISYSIRIHPHERWKIV